MAFKISKQKRYEIDAVLAEIDKAKAKLEDAVSAFNAAMEEKWGDVEDAAETYNSFRNSLLELLEGEADDHQSEFDERSKRWQESERGSETSEWIESLRNLESDLPEVEIDKPEDVTVEVVDSGDLPIEDEPPN